MTRQSQKASTEHRSSLAPIDAASEPLSVSGSGASDADDDDAGVEGDDDAGDDDDDDDDEEIDEGAAPAEGDEALVGEDLSALLHFDRMNR